MMEFFFEEVAWFKTFWLCCMTVLGACLGSFLNVLIYRLPRGVDLFTPARSFCPHCHSKIPFYRNIPIITWLLQRGKAACCGAPIAYHYVAVEAICALAFYLIWAFTPVQEASFLCTFFLILLTISWIDAETMLIPIPLAIFGIIMGLVSCVMLPGKFVINTPLSQLLEGLIGGVAGAAGLWIIAFLGKLAFGTRKVKFPEPTEWELREPKKDHEELSLVLKYADEEEEMIGWSELFFRKNEKLEIDAKVTSVNGTPILGSQAIIDHDHLNIDGKVYDIEKELKTLTGVAEAMRIPREAMGMGDVWLLGMLGCWLGWQGVLFSLFSSSVIALVWASLNKIGMGKQLPYGPFLCLGALIYWLWGENILTWYTHLVIG